LTIDNYEDCYIAQIISAILSTQALLLIVEN